VKDEEGIYKSSTPTVKKANDKLAHIRSSLKSQISAAVDKIYAVLRGLQHQAE
jgi:hypothetical protein